MDDDFDEAVMAKYTKLVEQAKQQQEMETAQPSPNQVSQIQEYKTNSPPTYLNPNLESTAKEAKHDSKGRGDDKKLLSLTPGHNDPPSWR